MRNFLFCILSKYYWADQVKENEVGRACGMHGRGEERKAYRVLVGKPDRKRSLGGPRSRWEDVIRLDLGEIGWGSVSGSGYGLVAGSCVYGDEPAGSVISKVVIRHEL
jgi:hypothetical protein